MNSQGYGVNAPYLYPNIITLICEKQYERRFIISRCVLHCNLHSKAYHGFILEKEEQRMNGQSSQSKATRKYEASHGWMSKTYKLKRETVEKFAAACEKAGVSQAGQLMKMMNQFIEEHRN